MNYLKLFFISLLFIGFIYFILKFSQAPLSDSDQAKIPEYPKNKISNGSPGCGNHVSKGQEGSFTYDGMKREYIISIPTNYDKNRPTQLIYAFHGRTNTNNEVKDYYDLERYSKQPTIFVYPRSLKQKGGTNTWNSKSSNLLDYELFDALNNKISTEYCINFDRVFIVGHSLGGAYVNSLGCKKANVLRGLASLGGGGVVNNCSDKIASMIIHNPKDRLVPYEGSEKVKDYYVELNGLDGEAQKIESEKFNCERHGDSNAQFPVVWCPHSYDYSSNGRYYPHTWPDKTGKLIMDFFESLN